MTSKDRKDWEPQHSNTFGSEFKGVQAEVGDEKQPDFKPQIKIKKWDNEVNLSVRFVEPDTSPIVPVKNGDRISYSKEKYDVHFYETKHRLNEENLKNKIDQDYSAPVELVTEPFEHLLQGGRIIGRDDEVERSIREEAAAPMKGDVLIAGLGLFVIGDYLQRDDVKVTVIEFSKEVIDLVQATHPDRLKGVEIIEGDFYEFVKNTKRRFDYVYGDIFPFGNYGNVAEYERFDREAQRVLKESGGVIDGRMREAYELMVARPAEDEGHEFEIVLKDRPDSNVFEFTMQTKGLEFLYQPELTEDEIRDGCFRPESVVGSYAVYHAKNQGGKYGSGKVAHIYRPKIIDKNGDWVWAELSIDEEAGVMRITVPQEFLDGAVYPVIVDPTFGYTTTGASFENGNGNVIYISQYNNTVGGIGGEVTGMTFVNNGGSSSADVKAALYNNDDTQLTNGQTNTNASEVAGTNNFTFPTNPTVAASTAYKLCMWAQGSKLNGQIKYDAGSSGDGATQALTFGTWPAPLVPSTNSRRYTLYATYTEISNISISVNDTVTATDVPTVNTVLMPSVFDAVTVVDIPVYYPDQIKVGEVISLSIVSSTHSPLVFDAVTVTEGVTIEVRVTPSVSDTVTVTEDVQLRLISYVSVNDAITVTDVPTVDVQVRISVFDVITVTDVIQQSGVSYPSPFDAVSVTESVTIMVVAMPSVFDAITVSEDIVVRVNVPVSVIDTISVTDVPTVVIPDLVPSVFDAVSITESVTMQMVSYVSVFDAITVTDVVGSGTGVSVNISVNDAVSVAEAITVVVVSMPQVNDAITVTEAVTVYIVSLVPSVFDAVTVLEGVTAQLVSYVNVNDNVTITEDVSLSVRLPVSVNDKISVWEDLGNNYVANGGFENAPPFTAAQTSSNWLDGTAAGSSTKQPYGLHVSFGGGGSKNAQIITDPHTGANSFRIQLTVAGGYCETRVDATGYTVTQGKQLQPNTEYSYSIWMKSENVSGSAGGQNVQFLFADFDGNSATVSFNGPGGSGTSSEFNATGSKNTNIGWTQYTGTFTTGPNVRWFHPEYRVYGHNGAATLVGDFYFDDISVLPTDNSNSGQILVISYPSVNDAVTVTDVPTIRVNMHPNVSDAITVTDVPTLEVRVSISVSDSVTVLEAPVAVINTQPTIVDFINVTDVPSIVIANLVPSVSDAITVTDVPTVEVRVTPSVSDLVTVTESVTMHMISRASVFDAITVTDVPSIDVRVSFLVFDVVTVTDSPTQQSVLNVFVFDTVTVDTVIIMPDIPQVLQVFDAITVSDSVSMVFRDYENPTVNLRFPHDPRTFDLPDNKRAPNYSEGGSEPRPRVSMPYF